MAPKIDIFLFSTFIFIVIFLFQAYVLGNGVTQNDPEMIVQEGATVTLNCSYTSTKYVLIWYLQKSDESLRFILHDESKKNDLDEEYRERFSAYHDPEKKNFQLKIRNIQWSDRGAYYCALEHVEARSLVFGHGTRLTVKTGDNNPSSPSVFVLKSNKTDSSAACFVKDFYPKDIEIYMNSTKGSSGPARVSPVLTRQGKYSAILVANLGTKNLQCQAKHQDIWLTNQDNSLRSKEKTTEAEGEDGPEEIECDPFEKLNMLFLTVLGVRVLFTKVVAFSLLMTAKLFVL